MISGDFMPKTHGVENRIRILEPIFRIVSHRGEKASDFDADLNVFYSEVDFRRQPV